MSYLLHLHYHLTSVLLALHVFGNEAAKCIMSMKLTRYMFKLQRVRFRVEQTTYPYIYEASEAVVSHHDNNNGMFITSSLNAHLPTNKQSPH